MAEHDRIVPARFGEALYRGLAEPKRLTVVEGAGHNDWAFRVDGQWWRDAIDFLLDESAHAVEPATTEPVEARSQARSEKPATD